jgi:phosphopantothenoylcysteine decarboxylase/phosphopantothenate--cysteine ligase
MQTALTPAAASADVVVMAAAVADFRPAQRTKGKLGRRQGDATLQLVPNPDLLAGLGAARRGPTPYLVGFAAEVDLLGEALVAKARAKLVEKRCDLIIANDVGTPGLGFGSDQNLVVLVGRDGPGLSLGPAPKTVLAEQIWAALADALPPRPEK